MRALMFASKAVKVGGREDQSRLQVYPGTGLPAVPYNSGRGGRVRFGPGKLCDRSLVSIKAEKASRSEQCDNVRFVFALCLSRGTLSAGRFRRC
jgi:hypothetical protein